MRTHSQLCHVTSDRCVVLVEAYEGTTPLGSALGEGGTAAEAEDQALSRLRSRLAASETAPVETAVNSSSEQSVAVGMQMAGTKQPEAIRRVAQSPQTTSDPAKQPPMTQPPSVQPTSAQPRGSADGSTVLESAIDPEPPSESPTDPEDWSEELTAIDLELQRVGWDRDSEKIYLERAFGHASRHRLTRFSDLVAYLKRLRDLSAGSDPQHAAIPLRRSDLVAQGDEILKRLDWSQQQAKDFLHHHVQANSRQQLTDEQLLNFNMLLEEQLINT